MEPTTARNMTAAAEITNAFAPLPSPLYQRVVLFMPYLAT
jgi:hypothetical protein